MTEVENLSNDPEDAKNEEASPPVDVSPATPPTEPDTFEDDSDSGDPDFEAEETAESDETE